VKPTTLYLIFAFFVFSKTFYAQTIPAQNSDTLEAKKVNKKAIYSRARKATIMSAVMPGLGQLYNRKYWKAPIVYAAIGGIGYWGITNHVEYKYYSDNLKAEYDNDPNTINVTRYSSDQLISQKNYYKKFRDMSIILGSLVYLVNILDANVDAHLKTFDVSDDLSLQVKPYSNIDFTNKLQTGLTLKLNFK
jgi:hypothetical protein